MRRMLAINVFKVDIVGGECVRAMAEIACSLWCTMVCMLNVAGDNLTVCYFSRAAAKTRFSLMTEALVAYGKPEMSLPAELLASHIALRQVMYVTG